MSKRALPCSLLVLPLLLLLGCRTSDPSKARYAVTVTPVDVVSGGVGLCIAVDPTDAKGVWWWQPGPSGCATRTTGPTVFAAACAAVKVSADSSTADVSFTLPLISGSREVRLRLQDSAMRVIASGVQVATQRRADLEIPPAYGR
jgi:hypothetical protein